MRGKNVSSIHAKHTLYCHDFVVLPRARVSCTLLLIAIIIIIITSMSEAHIFIHLNAILCMPYTDKTITDILFYAVGVRDTHVSKYIQYPCCCYTSNRNQQKLLWIYD